jgi:hypothetical protein
MRISLTQKKRVLAVSMCILYRVHAVLACCSQAETFPALNSFRREPMPFSFFIMGLLRAREWFAGEGCDPRI